MNAGEEAQVRQVLQRAYQAVRAGDRAQARRWATIATHLVPELEDPWLILAGVSAPEESLTYLKKALAINPASPRARQGMHWAIRRLRLARQAGPAQTQPARIPSHTPAVPPAARRNAPWLVLAALTCICLVSGLVIVAWAGFPALQAWLAPRPHPAQVLQAGNIPSTPGRSPQAVRRHTATAPGPSAALAAATQAPPATTSAATAVAASVQQPASPALTQLAPIPQATLSNPVYRTPPPVALPAGVRPGERWIDVDLAAQRTQAYEGSTPLRVFSVSTGTWDHPTVTGQYRVYVKYRFTDMAGPGYYLPNVPYTMYFYEGYALHGAYWHNNFGTPMSHGCVNLRNEDAGWLFDFASVGTLVNIH